MYTYFNPTRKVLMAFQIVEDAMAGASHIESVFPHETREDNEEVFDESEQDSVVKASVPKYSTLNYGKLGKSVADLIVSGAYVDNNGHVNATMKPLDDYTGFSSIAGEDEGYYFPFEINVPGAKGMVLSKTTIANGDYIEGDEKPYDNQFVLRIADLDKNQLIYDYKINVKMGEGKKDKVVELHFDKIKLQ